jgi:hypothetical protein
MRRIRHRAQQALVKGWQAELALSLANSGLGQRQALTSAFIVIVNLFFVHAPFHKRCKPGLSHWGLGLELRRATGKARAQFGRVLPSSALEI